MPVSRESDRLADVYRLEANWAEIPVKEGAGDITLIDAALLERYMPVDIPPDIPAVEDSVDDVVIPVESTAFTKTLAEI